MFVGILSTFYFLSLLLFSFSLSSLLMENYYHSRLVLKSDVSKFEKQKRAFRFEIMEKCIKQKTLKFFRFQSLFILFFCIAFSILTKRHNKLKNKMLKIEKETLLSFSATNEQYSHSNYKSSNEMK